MIRKNKNGVFKWKSFYSFIIHGLEKDRFRNSLSQVIETFSAGGYDVTVYPTKWSWMPVIRYRNGRV